MHCDEKKPAIFEYNTNTNHKRIYKKERQNILESWKDKKQNK